MDSNITLTKEFLIVEFPRQHDVLSWAVLNGGRSRTSKIVWHQVRNYTLVKDVDPCLYLEHKLKSESINNAVCLLTSAEINRYIKVAKNFNEISAQCVATVGLTNALRVGDPPGEAYKPVSTINILVQLSVPLSENAFVEAISIATEARTAAILDSKIASTQTHLPATGTGTDCIVIAAPTAESPNAFAGKHTALGHVIGASVYEAVKRGAK